MKCKIQLILANSISLNAKDEMKGLIVLGKEIDVQCGNLNQVMDSMHLIISGKKEKLTLELY